MLKLECVVLEKILVERFVIFWMKLDEVLNIENDFTIFIILILAIFITLEQLYNSFKKLRSDKVNSLSGVPVPVNVNVNIVILLCVQESTTTLATC